MRQSHVSSNWANQPFACRNSAVAVVEIWPDPGTAIRAGQSRHDRPRWVDDQNFPMSQRPVGNQSEAFGGQNASARVLIESLQETYKILEIP
jgi:hypothetical protein